MTALRPVSYVAAANKLRRLADRIEALANASTPQQRRALTLNIHAAARAAQHLSQRHRSSP